MPNVENWGDERHFPVKKLIVVILLASIVIASVYAVVKITSPPSDPVTVNTLPTLSKPSLNATSVFIGDTVQISTTLSSHADGLQVFFYENDVSIGSAYTGSGGIAIFNRVVSTPGTYTYKADCMVS